MFRLALLAPNFAVRLHLVGARRNSAISGNAAPTAAKIWDDVARGMHSPARDGARP
jgi:hypothetical protein